MSFDFAQALIDFLSIFGKSTLVILVKSCGILPFNISWTISCLAFSVSLPTAPLTWPGATSNSFEAIFSSIAFFLISILSIRPW